VSILTCLVYITKNRAQSNLAQSSHYQNTAEDRIKHNTNNNNNDNDNDNEDWPCLFGTLLLLLLLLQLLSTIPSTTLL